MKKRGKIVSLLVIVAMFFSYIVPIKAQGNWQQHLDQTILKVGYTEVYKDNKPVVPNANLTITITGTGLSGKEYNTVLIDEEAREVEATKQNGVINGDTTQLVLQVPGTLSGGQYQVRTTIDSESVTNGLILLNNVNLSIKAGEVYGLVGVNGSGKSTLMKIIMNTLKATKGNVYLFGNKVTEYDKDVYKRISAIIETPIFYEELTIEKNLEIVCRYMDLNHKERIEEVKKLVGLHGVLKKKPKELSLGMRERVAIGRGLLNRPDLVILDEPTNGLDIIKIKEIIDLITNLKRERKTSFLISTHMLDKLEVLADRVGFLYNGSIGYELGGYDLIDEKRDYVKLVCDDVSKAAFVIEGKLGIKGYKVINNNVIRLYDLKEDYNKVIFELIKSGVFVESFNRNKRKLQEFFMDIISGGNIHD